jgi:Skp family chaperone for outer membrane proteins
MPEQESSLGTRILRFFVKEEEPAPTASGLPPVTGTTQPRPAPPATGPSATTSPSAAGESTRGESTAPADRPGNVDPKFAEHLANVLAQNNPPGPDYFEFRETLKSLTSLGLSEEKQFQAAWASFKALGGPTDVGVLTRTANQYVAALQKDRDGFAKSVDAALAERVGGLENEQKRLQAENDALTRQLQEIDQKRAANTERLSAITGEMTEQSARIRQNQQNYETTHAHFVDQINDDVRKLSQYLTV